MAKTIMYQFYPILKAYPVWGPEDPLKPFYHWGIWQMQGQIPRLASYAEEGTEKILWLSGALKSPRFDHGYDVEDYYLIEPYVASRDEFFNFIWEAHNYKFKVVIDLVLNHTSTKCRWFKEHPEWYWWAKEPKDGWRNLFNNGPAWEYDAKRGEYYCHMFHKEQADLKWFHDDGSINEELVTEFRHVVDYWEHMGVDGFRLDVPQSINKDPNSATLDFNSLMGNNDRAIEVINSVFKYSDCTLAMEMFDTTMDGAIMKEYLNRTNVKYIMNVVLKDVPAEAREKMIMSYSEYEGFMLDLESHDSMRFMSREGATRDQELTALFWTGAQNICIYQGQELGLKNPELTDEQILALDAQTKMQYEAGVPINHETTRANARVPFPEDELERQEQDDDSFLKGFESELRLWQKIG